MIRGQKFCFWRAVDSEGEVLDFLVQRRRNTRAAARLMRKLLKKTGIAPSIMVTDKLGPYGAAKTKLGLSAVHEQGLRKNNRCENSHLPVTADVAIELEDDTILVRDDVRAACELLDFDPIHVANEGRFVTFVGKVDAERSLAILKDHGVSQGATIAGSVQAAPAGQVTMRSAFGSTRAVDMLSGEQLLRIC